MISLADYVGPHAKHPDWTPARQENAKLLLAAMNAVLAEAVADGVKLRKNPKTGTYISGTTFGGFRPQDCPQGAPQSNHKQGNGGDVFDPTNELDAWCMSHQDRLAAHGIWIEHPSKTDTWCHMQRIPPKSGNRVYYP